MRIIINEGDPALEVGDMDMVIYDESEDTIRIVTYGDTVIIVEPDDAENLHEKLGRAVELANIETEANA